MSEQGNIVQNTDTKVTDEKEPDLRDDIRYAIHDIEARKTETPEQTEARQRDEQGRFVKAEESPQPEAKGEERKTLTLPAAATNASADGLVQAMPAIPAVKPPDTWSAEGKAVFNKLDPIAQKEIAKREGDMMKALTAHDEYRTLGKRIAEESAPYMHIIRSEGGDEGLAYKNFLNYAYIVRQGTQEQKQQALLQLARQFNIPLGQPAHQSQADPVAQYLQPLQSEVQRMRQELDQANQSRDYQEQAQLTGEIAGFASDPAHPYFEKVREAMGIYLETGQAPDLEKAYDKAIWADPEIRTALMAQASTQRLSQNQAATEAARKAAGSVIGGPGSAKPNGQTFPDNDDGLKETIRAAMRASSGRV